jgi:hypothetical protein
MHGIKRLEMSRELPRLHFIFVAFTALGGADYFGRINFMHLSGECRRAVESESEYDRDRAQFELPNFHGEFSALLRSFGGRNKSRNAIALGEQACLSLGD